MDKQYYSNLLIRQFSNKPKAKQTVELEILNNCNLVNNVYSQLLNAFDIETATGKQLDIIGKYVGQSRNFNVVMFYKLFSYTEPNIENSNAGYSEPNELMQGVYVSPQFLQKATYTADDNTYRFFIKLAIAKNRGKYTDYTISNAIFDIFNKNIIFIDNRDMTIQYILLNSIDPNIKSILSENKYLLPAPAGVLINLITFVPNDKIFGYQEPNKISSIYQIGYSTPTNLVNSTYLTPKNLN